jgi:hypothetical protein
VPGGQEFSTGVIQAISPATTIPSSGIWPPLLTNNPFPHGAPSENNCHWYR